jgi:hypothetical protein
MVWTISSRLTSAHRLRTKRVSNSIGLFSSFTGRPARINWKELRSSTTSCTAFSSVMDSPQVGILHLSDDLHGKFIRAPLTGNPALINSRTCSDAIDHKRNPQDSTESPSPELNEKEEVICDKD